MVFFSSFRQLKLLVWCAAFVCLTAIGNISLPAPQVTSEPSPVSQEGISVPKLEELKQTGYERSRFRDSNVPSSDSESISEVPQPKLAEFSANIKPLLEEHCIDCHGPDSQEGISASIR
ncbi:MAG: hypothetical protein R3C53_12995 [Pirellulaceae bacterium]